VGEERRTYHWGGGPTPNQRRVPVSEAAQALGISEGAVRMRVKRGTLPSTREGGRLYVLLHTEPTTEPERPHDRTAELIATLREQLEAEREANRENRRIIAALTSRIPEIEPPRSEQEATPSTEPPRQEARESPVVSAVTDEQAEEAVRGPTEPSERPWWRRMFGG
jgi:hypothetical protein